MDGHAESTSLPLGAVLLVAVLVAAFGALAPRGPAGPPGPLELPPWPEELEGRAWPRRPVAWDAPVPPRPALDAALAARGGELYPRLCTACHGESGRGDGELAPWLASPPRDLPLGRFKLKSTAAGEPAAPEDLYRTLTAGIPAYGMPSFAHLPERDRWALVVRVLELARLQGRPRARPLELPGRRGPDRGAVSRGRAVYLGSGCAACHGVDLAGDGPSAAGLVDEAERPAAVPDLSRGPGAFRRGALAADVAATLLAGMPGTPMPSYLELASAPRDLWDLALYVEARAMRGEAERRAAWTEFFRRWRSEHPPGVRRARARIPPAEGTGEPVPPGPAGEGCLRCHAGIEDINERMRTALLALAGGAEGRACVACHEGDPDATRVEAAHRGLVANPGDLWAVSLGLGCGRCHADRGSLASVHGRPLPEPVGGSLLQVRTRVMDPTGDTGGGHAYRIQRSLMALEAGKVTHVARSAGILGPGEWRYADFDVDDPDGPVPVAGGEAYRRWVEEARRAGFLPALDRLEELPGYDAAVQRFGDERRAGWCDVARKECNQCHLWGVGRRKYREHRASGCAACHVPYTLSGTYQGGDPTTRRDEAGRPAAHRVVLAVPDSQCFRCHNREFQRHNDEVHDRSLGCADCHGSIDMHGDGNLAPSIPFQLEGRCEDCHGTREAAPWDLPLGIGTPVVLEGPRGTHDEGGRRYLRSSRGNVRANWLREGEGVVVLRVSDGGRVPAPLLRDAPAAVGVADPHGADHAGLGCGACHSARAVRCGTCHMRLDLRARGEDFIASGLDFDPADFGRRTVSTRGESWDPREEVRPWWPRPEVFRDASGRAMPHVRPCEPDLTLAREGAEPLHASAPAPTGMAPQVAHEFNREARPCAECHPEGGR
ncbi:MAG: c-type cytochrome [Planctomycetes bacterium]|nr:c-type cytochrome [Planctomycetota bacterium]